MFLDIRMALLRFLKIKPHISLIFIKVSSDAKSLDSNLTEVICGAQFYLVFYASLNTFQLYFVPIKNY